MKLVIWFEWPFRWLCLIDVYHIQVSIESKEMVVVKSILSVTCVLVVP